MYEDMFDHSPPTRILGKDDDKTQWDHESVFLNRLDIESVLYLNQSSILYREIHNDIFWRSYYIFAMLISQEVREIILEKVGFYSK